MKPIFILLLTLSMVLAVLTSITACSDDETEPTDQEPATMKISGELSSTATRLAGATQTPSHFYVIPTKIRMFRGTDDADPPTLYDIAEEDSIEVVDLTDGAQTLYDGTIPVEYLGDYTHIELTIAGAGQEITYHDDGGANTKTYAQFYVDVDNSDALISEFPSVTIEAGDILLLEGSSFMYWMIDADTMYYTSLGRTCVDSSIGDSCTNMTDSSTFSPYTFSYTSGDEVIMMALTDTVSIESGGSYTVTVDFDVTDTFEYTDRDTNDEFNPVDGDHNGEVNGIEFNIKVPEVTVSAVQ